MSSQIQITGETKVKSLTGVLVGTTGVVSSLAFDVAGGVPKLDVNGKILVAQLPNSVMEYKGVWNAATNSPTLTNGGAFNEGDVYLCNVAGTVNFGAGPIAFFVGDQAIYSGSIWQRASGATGTVTSVAVTETGDSLNITGSPITTSGTINIGFNGTNLQYVNGAGNLTTFPILTGYVPYTGATQDVDLGAFKLNAQSLHIKGTAGNGHLGLKHQSASATASANEVSLFADTLGDLSWLNGNLYLSKFITSGNTAARSYTFPNATCNIPDDSLVVHLAGTETITGAKTFSAYTTFTSTVDITSGLTFSNSGFTLVLQPPTLSVNRTVTLPNGTGTLALTSDISYPVTSVFGRTGAVVATSGDYTTAQVTESGNLYFTDSRARLAISLTTTGTSGASTYNNTTGVLNIPQYTDQFVGTVTSVAALTIGTSGTDLSSSVANSTTTPVITLNVPTASAANRGALASADWSTFNSKQGTITLTTTGTSGAATFSANTLNIPNYGSALSGYLPLTGGTLTGALGGTSATFTSTLLLNSASSPSAGFILFNYASNASSRSWKVSNDQVDWGDFAIQQSTTQTGSTYATKLLINATGNVGINTSTVPAKLTIYTGVGGAFPATSGTTQSNGLVARYKDTSNACIDYGTNGGSGGWLQVTNITDLSASYPFLINPNGGNVGIGTDSPSNKLYVVASGTPTTNGDNSGLFVSNQTSGLTNDGIGVGSNGFASYKWIQSYNGYLCLNPIGNNVGIGTSSPQAKLEVSGSIMSSGSDAAAAANKGVLDFNTGNTRLISFGPNSSTNGGFQFLTLTSSGTGSTPMTITSGGNVLIGTTTDAGYKLYVDGGSSNGMAFYSTSPANQFKIAGSAAAMTFTNTIASPSMGGSLGVATSAGDFLSGTAAGDTIFINQFSGKKLYAVSYSGGVYLSSGATSWTANSDIRLKNINSHIENAVEKLSTLQTINFSYKDDKFKRQNLGLIAQEVEKIFPELIDKNDDGMLGVRYTELVPVLVKAIQEQQKEINELKQLIK